MRKIKGLKKTIYVVMCAVLLTGCSKKETPVMSNKVETEITTEDEVITKSLSYNVLL